jgi:membrane protein implicated in regulation of membrane protease activity
MSLEIAYWIALGAGVVFLLLSLVLGDVFDFLDFLDFDLPGTDFAATPVFLTATAAFGAGGLLGLNAFHLGTGGSVLAGLGTSVVLGGLAAVLFAALRRQEAGEGFTTSQLVGATGRCTLAIKAGGTGRVTIQHRGMTRTHAATSTEDISAGDEVLVVDVVGNLLKVARA